LARLRNSQASERRLKILEAARREFGLKGFAGARVEAIARRAGVNKGLIFYYFESKEGLFRALAEERFSHQTTPGASEPEDALQWPLSLFELGDETLDWARFFMWEGLDVDQAMPALLMEDKRRQGWERRLAWVTEQQRIGKLPADLNPGQLTLFLYVLGIYPYLMPQLAYIVTGSLPGQPAFAREFESFLNALGERLRLTLTKRSK
jgi:TetR/AcrR family transcriptional regulator